MAKGYKLTGTNTILDLVKAAETAEAYRDSVNKSYAKPWKLFSSPPDSVWQEYQGLEYDRNEKRFDIFHNPSPTKNLKEEKTILEVFGEKSKDADTVKGFLKTLMFGKAGERDSSSYVSNDPDISNWIRNNFPEGR